VGGGWSGRGKGERWSGRFIETGRGFSILYSPAGSHGPSRSKHESMSLT